jgi:hypothetical protein
MIINSVAINNLSLRVWELVKGGGVFKQGEPLKTEPWVFVRLRRSDKRSRNDDDTEAEEQGRADTPPPLALPLTKRRFCTP